MQPLGLAQLCATYLSVISCHGWVGWGTKFFKPSSRRAMWGRGQVCLDLMSLTRPHGDETAGGSTLCWLGRCLVSLVLRLMAEYSPNDPLRCGLNSTTSNTRCLVPSGAVRQNPARVWHGCCLAASWLGTIVRHLSFCDLVSRLGGLGHDF